MVEIGFRSRARGRTTLSLRPVWLAILCCGCLSGHLSASGPVEIDTDRSILTVRVYRSGLFSAFAHDHEIRAPIKTGTFDENANTIDLLVDARTLRVIDRDASEKDRAEIQSTMLGPKVLDSERFPEIRFHATSVERTREGKWTLRGELALHGESRPLLVEAEGQNGHYHGSAELRQKDFAITPITVAGGTVKVKNEVRLEFEIFGKGAN